MIFCPFPDRPIVSQWFGANPPHYAQYGMKGHNGIDFAVPVGPKIYAPHEGFVSIRNQGSIGYGRHVIIKSRPYKDNTCRETTLAHLFSTLTLQEGQFISAGDLLALSGGAKNADGSGDSTGPHCHWTYKILDAAGNTLNYENGFHGAVNLSPIVNGVRQSNIQIWILNNLLR